MNDCTTLAEKTLKSIFDPKQGDFRDNMKELDRALTERERQDSKYSSNTRMARSAS